MVPRGCLSQRRVSAGRPPLTLSQPPWEPEQPPRSPLPPPPSPQVPVQPARQRVLRARGQPAVRVRAQHHGPRLRQVQEELPHAVLARRLLPAAAPRLSQRVCVHRLAVAPGHPPPLPTSDQQGHGLPQPSASGAADLITNMHAHTRAQRCAHKHACTDTRVNMRTQLHIDLHAQICTHKHAHMHAQMHVNTCTHSQRYAHTNVHMCTR